MIKTDCVGNVWAFRGHVSYIFSNQIAFGYHQNWTTHNAICIPRDALTPRANIFHTTIYLLGHPVQGPHAL